MKIVFLTRLFYPHIGGVEKHVFELSKRLVAAGHTVTIIAEKTNDDVENLSDTQREVMKSFTAHYIPVKEGRLKKFTIWSWMKNHQDILSSADVIHCHDVFFWVMLYRLRHPLKKIYTTFHGYESYPIHKKAIIVRKISEKLSNGNIIIGDFIAKWYKTRPTIVSYGAVETPEEPKTYRESSAVFFGRLDDQTGILMYRDAFLKIREIYPNFTLTVVGEGKYQKNILAIKGVTVMPFTPEVEPLLIKHRFIFVSRYLSILEALSQNRAVFAVYDNPVKEDYLRMAPFASYINVARSAAELATQVIGTIEDEDTAEKKIKEGYLFAATQTWKKLVNDYLHLWTGKKSNLRRK